jgi:CubicO group peptidase (beta-lactamase class C family)
VLVRHLLSHTAGLPAWPLGSGFEPRVLLDWDRATTMLADAATFWAPGTAFRYHSATFGFLVGEVIRRITGRSPGQYVAAELAGPLGLDLWIRAA